MSAAPFLAALYAVRTGLLLIGAITPAEAVVIEISPEAGLRFEIWLAKLDHAQRITMGIEVGKLGTSTVGAYSDNPYREIEIRNVLIRWQTGRIARRDGTGEAQPSAGSAEAPILRMEDIPHG